MQIACAKYSLLELFDLVYETVHENIPNPNYHPPRPSCSHYSSVDEMTTPFCPECGTKNTPIITPVEIIGTTYKLRDTGEIINSSKLDVLKQFVTKLYKEKAVTISGYKFDIDVDGGTLMFLSPSYSQGKLRTDPEEIIDNLGNYSYHRGTIYVICFRMNYTPTIEHLQNCIDRIKLFQKLGLKDIGYVIPEDFTPRY